MFGALDSSNTVSGTTFSDLVAPGEDEISLGADSSRRPLLIIDGRALERQCLALSISSYKKEMPVLSCGSIADWETQRNGQPIPAAILVNIGEQQLTVPAVADGIRSLCETTSLPIILLADSDDIGQIISALECGVKGYIPTSVSLDVCVEAISLSLAGGIFIPANSLLAMRGILARQPERPVAAFFTDRQLAVAEALRRGKANKIIAYELNMQESTVKVHVRNIMKKVKASNRTEVAYKLMELFPPN